MSEIDPWALPQGGAGSAGIPGSRPMVPRVAPVGRVLPILVTVLGSLYVVASIVEIFIVNSQISLVNQFNAEAATNSLPANAAAQANASDSHVNAGADVTAVIYLAMLVAIVVWERRLKAQLGSVGARRAVFARAGYTYFRATWLISFVLGLFLITQSNNDSQTTLQDVINHDHLLMVYYGLRALLGAVLVVFSVRMMRITDDGFARLSAAGF